MNGRRLFREYAQSRGCEAVGFVKIEEKQEYYSDRMDTYLITLDSKGKEERIDFSYKDMVHWIIKTKKYDRTNR
jgi:hypothetical protein